MDFSFSSMFRRYRQTPKQPLIKQKSPRVMVVRLRIISPVTVLVASSKIADFSETSVKKGSNPINNALEPTFDDAKFSQFSKKQIFCCIILLITVKLSPNFKLRWGCWLCLPFVAAWQSMNKFNFTAAAPSICMVFLVDAGSSEPPASHEACPTSVNAEDVEIIQLELLDLNNLICII